MLLFTEASLIPLHAFNGWGGDHLKSPTGGAA